MSSSKIIQTIPAKRSSLLPKYLSYCTTSSPSDRWQGQVDCRTLVNMRNWKGIEKNANFESTSEWNTEPVLCDRLT